MSLRSQTTAAVLIVVLIMLVYLGLPFEAERLARAQDRAASALGFSLAAIDRQEPPQDDRGRVASLRSLARKLDEEARGPAKASLDFYVRSQRWRVEETVQPPPPALAAFLEAHSRELRQLEQTLEADPLPSWLRDAEGTHKSFGGDVWAPRSWLAARGYGALARGEFKAALPTLTALSRLEASRDDQALFVWDALWRHADILALLRRVNPPYPSSVVTRLQDDLRRRLLESEVSEQRRMRRDIDESARRERQQHGLLVSTLFLGPAEAYTRTFAAADGQASLRAVEELQGADLCAIDPEAFARRHSRPRWLPELTISGRAEVAPALLASLTPALLQVELTHVVMQAREARARSNAHRWPEALGELRSSACPSVGWAYEVGVDGGMTVHFGRALPDSTGDGPSSLRFSAAHEGRLGERGRT